MTAVNAISCQILLHVHSTRKLRRVSNSRVTVHRHKDVVFCHSGHPLYVILNGYFYTEHLIETLLNFQDDLQRSWYRLLPKAHHPINPFFSISVIAIDRRSQNAVKYLNLSYTSFALAEPTVKHPYTKRQAAFIFLLIF